MQIKDFLLILLSHVSHSQLSFILFFAKTEFFYLFICTFATRTINNYEFFCI